MDCGGGADSAVVDRRTSWPSALGRPRVAPGRRKSQLRRLEEDGEGEPRGRFSYSFRAGARLRGKAVFRGIATKSFRAPGSGKVKLNVTVPRKKLALLRRKGKIKTKVTVTLRDGAGGSSKASAKLTLKR